MARDPTNYFQDTGKQIEKKIKLFTDNPKYFTPYLKKRGLLDAKKMELQESGNSWSYLYKWTESNIISTILFSCISDLFSIWLHNLGLNIFLICCVSYLIGKSILQMTLIDIYSSLYLAYIPLKAGYPKQGETLSYLPPLCLVFSYKNTEEGLPRPPSLM